LNVLKSAFKDAVVDGKNLLDYMKENLVGLTTDGASVFSGKKGGLGILLSKEIFGDEKKLFRTHCLAHKLNLVGNRLVESVHALQKFEQDIQSLSTNFNALNSKNFAYLVRTAKSYGIEMPRISYVFSERWANNKELVLRRLRKGLPVLKVALESMSVDPIMKGDAANKAKGLLDNVVRDVNFVLLVHFMSDILHHLSMYSKLFQQSLGVLIGMEKHRKDMVEGLTIFETTDGAFLGDFVDQLECKKNELSTSWVKCKTVAKVLSSFQVRWV
jgi:hypothetical protein